MTILLSKSEAKDINKSHIFQLCNFLIEERRPPKSTTLTGPISIPLKNFAELSEYTNTSTNELSIEKLKQTLVDLNSDYITEDRPTTIITIENIEILNNFQESYNNNEKITIRCSKERLEAYKDKLKEYAKKQKDTEQKAEKIYRDCIEEINLSIIGVKIEGPLVKKGEKEGKINPTDRKIIYFLYYKSLINEEETFTENTLNETGGINRAPDYIRNRITIINNLIRRMISSRANLRIAKFIKKESGRGYRLNPKVMHKT